MQVIQSKLRFLTPAFLGDAEQKAAWRTPPIKAQLRQFWRMVQAAHGVTSVDAMRQAEAELFGSASGDSGHKSLVRLRLDRWSAGSLTSWGKLATRKVSVGNNQVAAALYLGFGPLTYDKQIRGPSMEHPPAIGADSSAELRLAVVPHQDDAATVAEQQNDIAQALGLMQQFGTLGGRSRNGWGSYCMSDIELASITPYLRPWEEALAEAWPRGLGADAQGPLWWQSSGAFSSWEDAMVKLAELRAGINRCGGERTLLSYPVTGKPHHGWEDQDRLPSSLRFKVVPGEGSKLRAQIAHFPCRPNDDLMRQGSVNDQALLDAWHRVHAWLDGQSGVRRVALKEHV